MSFEYLDIVNEHDTVIGRSEKNEAHKKNLCHRMVHVLVVDAKNRIIVQQRAANKSSSPLKFDASVGGHVVSGESYEEAAHREMQEELGISAEIDFLGKVRVDVPHDKMLGHVYLCRHDGPYTNWEEEAERLEFFTPDELHNTMKRLPYLFCSSFIDSFHLLYEAQKI